MNIHDVLAMLNGAIVTLGLSIASIAIGLPAGLALALIRWGRVPFLHRVIALVVSVLRATPLVTLLLLLFFAVPVAGVDISPVAAGILALVLSTAAFNSEIWRSALMAFPREQLEAARSVGMTRILWFRLIVLPQIFRTALPGLVNEMSMLIKLTPVLAVVGVVDITRAAVRVGARTYEPLPPFLVAIALYVPIVYLLLIVQKRLEIRMQTMEQGA